MTSEQIWDDSATNAVDMLWLKDLQELILKY
jgi:hypothetical protein